MLDRLLNRLNVGRGAVRGPSALLRDRRGNILPMAAAAVLITAALVGGGVDLSRAYRVQNRLQAACDAGVLAGRRAVTTNGYDTAAKNQATSYFNVNFSQTRVGANSTSFTSSSTDSGNTVTGVASTTVDTLIMKIFGNTKMSLTARCTSTMGVGNSDVTMVLDTTGSMDYTLSGTSQTRIQALRTAMKNFYTTVATATAGTNARIRYAFVPYSSTVNVGRLLYDLDPDYLVDSYAIQSRQAYYTHYGTPVSSTGGPDTDPTGSSDPVLHSSTGYNSSSSCNSSKPSNTAWTNDGAATTSDPVTTYNGSNQKVETTTTTQPQIRTVYDCDYNKKSKKYYIYRNFEYRDYLTYEYETSDPYYSTVENGNFHHWEYRKVTYDVSAYKAFQTVTTSTGANGTAESSIWAGCIEERKAVNTGTFSYSALTGMSPSDALDLDIDTAPDADDTTKWAPMWPEVAYRRSGTATASSGSKASSPCPYAARKMATISQSEFNAYADALIADGNTYHDIGMIWGARLSSPDGIFDTLINEAPANGGNVSRHLIFMTDGEMMPNNRIQQAYGIEFLDRRITSDGSSNDSSRHTSRFRAVCDAVKAKGIRVWVIAFASTMTTDLNYCASSNSAFTATNATQLNSAFQEIAKQVGELRLSQ